MIDRYTKNLFLLSAISGIMAVVIGAFGAHSLSDHISADSLVSYKTGVSYQFYHTLASILSLVMYINFKSKQFRWASLCFLIGILFFSGSIYLLTTNDMTEIGMRSILGPMTPIGGLLFIVAWCFVFIGVLKIKSE